jgi:DNA polymerase III subunit beta
MKIQIEKEPLSEALAYCQNIAEKRSTMPILSHGLLQCEKDGLSITTTDLEVYAKSRVAGQAITPGKCCIPIRSLASIIKDLPADALEMHLQDNQSLEISSGSAVFRLNTLPPEDFPSFRAGKSDQSVKIQSTILKQLLDYTLISMSSDETRVVLNSILFDLRDDKPLRVVSTDGHRLSFVDAVKLDEGLSISSLGAKAYILPKKGAVELRRLCEHVGEATIGIYASDQTLTFEFENHLLSSRLIEGQYPDYQKVLGATLPEIRYTMDRSAFAAALKRTSLLSSEKSRAVQFTFAKDRIDLYCTSESLGDARESLVPDAVDGFKGDKVVVTFNARYLLEPVLAMPSDKIQFCVKDRDSHAVFIPDGIDYYQSIVMPMRI